MLADVTIAELVVFLVKLLIASGIVALCVLVPFVLLRWLARKLLGWRMNDVRDVAWLLGAVGFIGAALVLYGHWVN